MTKNKRYKLLCDELVNYVGIDSAGIIIAGMLDAFEKLTKDNDFFARSMKLIINNYFEYELCEVTDEP